MKLRLQLVLLVLLALSSGSSLFSQARSSAFPASIASAKTVAIVNDTHQDGVTEGAIEGLRA